MELVFLCVEEHKMHSNRIGRGIVCALVAVAWCGTANAQVQTKKQQACIKAMNQRAAKVGQVQAKENLACLKEGGKGELVGSAQDCLTADAGNKLTAMETKTLDLESRKCATAPDFGYTSGATVDAVAEEGRLRTFADLFGPNLNATLIPCGSDEKACRCQQSVALATEKVVSAKWKTFLKCKKDTLATATSTADLGKCVDDAGLANSIAADPTEKIAKSIGKLSDKIDKKCDAEGVTGAAFAVGDCASLTGSTLATCIDRQVECRVCQTINDADGLDVDCDLFDDGASNVTCDCSHQIGDSNLEAAITKQIVSITEPTTLTIELTTQTDLPFKPTVTDLTFPEGFDLQSLQTTSCNEGSDTYVCKHQAILEATTACEGTGDYEMTLTYNCSPTVSNCPACNASTTIPFHLTTEVFCGPS
jgi:hypothetical protein